ncbi:FG-GAP-like repeat-containing protein [Hymenobacter crusticola]|uniref:SbsA Ig-like domain-containing protein n=1 Tax=Hymenobacter crusticola TaxID=1770526 RepID=A0A243W7R7_9BACT|nr:FG-GAP-like repeat-containing protein [Hymenobacter crusticola]OUJ71095.1 hypothetical protein BXP70_22525 [Hymenobacter crusticola]
MVLFATLASRLAFLTSGASFPAVLRTGGLLLLAGSAQAQALTLSSVAPTRNALAASRATNVAAVFSQPLSTNGTPQQALKVFSRQAGGRKAGTVSLVGNTVSFDPAIDFKPGETVLATLPTMTLTGGGPVTLPHVFQFTTAAAAAPGTFNGGSEVVLGTLNHAHLAVGDVDGDGDLDFVTTNVNANSVSVRLNNGSASFSGTQEVPVGNAPLDLALADLDSDGDLDLLTTNLTSNTVSVRLNNGTGIFSGTQEVAVGTVPQSVTLGDLDGDGDLDLAVGATGDGQVTIRLNNGSGTFSGTTAVGVGNQPVSVVLGDVDADGDLDLLTANYNDNATVSVRLNNGTGTFTGTQEVVVGSLVRDLALGDVDGDGDLDLATVSSLHNSTISIRLNNGSGSFGGTQEVAARTDASTVVLADVDGDADLDLLATSHAYLDGATSIVGSNGVSVRLNNGTGIFSGNQEVPLVQPTTNFNSPLDLALGDVDGDGDLDLLASNSNNSVSVRLNQLPPPAFTLTALMPGRNTLSAARSTPVKVTLNQSLSTDSPTLGALHVFSAQSGGQKAGTATVNGSTLAFTPASGFRAGETVFATLTGSALNLAGNAVKPTVFQFTTATTRSNALFNAGADVALSAAPAGVALGDVNGDGALDFVAANPLINTVSVRLNSGTGTFSGTQEVAVSPGRTPEFVALGDVDGDGDLDLVVAASDAATTNTGSLIVRLNNGTGLFSSGASYSIGYAPRSVVLGDFDGDGDLDLATANGAAGTLSVSHNDGKGVFVETQRFNLRSTVANIAVGDIDGDGALDLVATTALTNAVQLLRNGGNGLFAIAGTLSVSSPGSVALGDVNGDGTLDVLATSGATVSVRLGNGAGAFSSGQSLATDGPLYALALGDVDGDGDLDVVGTSYNTNAVSVRLNNGAGTFSGATAVAVGTLPYGLALGDLNNDGTLDLATANRSGNSVSIRLNSQVLLATVPAQLAAQVSLYPNPAHSSVQLHLPAELARHSVQLRVLNTLGQVVMQQNLAGQVAQQVSLPSLAAGVYQVQIGTRLGVIHERLLVE